MAFVAVALGLALWLIYLSFGKLLDLNRWEDRVYTVHVDARKL